MIENGYVQGGTLRLRFDSDRGFASSAVDGEVINVQAPNGNGEFPMLALDVEFPLEVGSGCLLDGAGTATILVTDEPTVVEVSISYNICATGAGVEIFRARGVAVW